MKHIVWRESLNTNIKVIDEQHRRIVSYINTLIDSRHDPAVVGQVINDLVDYTVSHFSYEEVMMEKAKYQFLEPHKRVHKLFIRRVDTFLERARNGEDVTDELINVLKNWLINHIKNEDADYVEAVMASQHEVQESMEHEGVLAKFFKRFF